VGKALPGTAGGLDAGGFQRLPGEIREREVRELIERQPGQTPRSRKLLD
jgi:hypothetical protein